MKDQTASYNIKALTDDKSRAISIHCPVKAKEIQLVFDEKGRCIAMHVIHTGLTID